MVFFLSFHRGIGELAHDEELMKLMTAAGF